MQEQIHDRKLTKHRCHLLLEAFKSRSGFTNRSSYTNGRWYLKFNRHTYQHHG
jgi:hypothetical protein